MNGSWRFGVCCALALGSRDSLLIGRRLVPKEPFSKNSPILECAFRVVINIEALCAVVVVAAVAVVVVVVVVVVVRGEMLAFGAHTFNTFYAQN